MNLVPLRTVLFEKRIPQNLPFAKTWQDMGKTKTSAAKPKNRPEPPQMQRAARRKSCKNAAYLLWNGGKYVILSCMMRHRQAVRQGTLTPPS